MAGLDNSQLAAVIAYLQANPQASNQPVGQSFTTPGGFTVTPTSSYKWTSGDPPPGETTTGAGTSGASNGGAGGGTLPPAPTVYPQTMSQESSTGMVGGASYINSANPPGSAYSHNITPATGRVGGAGYNSTSHTAYVGGQLAPAMGDSLNRVGGTTSVTPTKQSPAGPSSTQSPVGGKGFI
jgi:hypothetical protein